MKTHFRFFIYLIIMQLELIGINSVKAEFVNEFETARFQKVFIIVLENTDYDEAIKQPFLKELASKGALFTNFTAEIHPSQGNYIAMTSGNTYNINHDRKVDLNVPHIADLLEKGGLTWKVYAEKYPGNCFLNMSKGTYVRKHVPFLSYENIQNDEKRCANIVNADAFDSDFTNGTLSNYSFYVPDLKNDGHDTGIGYADRWLEGKFRKLLSDPKFMKDMLFIVTLDESDSRSPNKIYTMFYGDSVLPGSINNSSHNHYSILKLLEENFGLDNLGQKDVTAPSILDIWK